MPKLGTPAGLDHLEPHLTQLRAPVDEGDRFYSFSFSAPLRSCLACKTTARKGVASRA